MILHPLSSAAHASSVPIPAWNAVAASQQQNATEWWLIAQPDHAALAGDLAAQFAASDFPNPDPEVVQAIALHDAGWAKYDGGGASGCGKGSAPQPLRNNSGRPLSFLEVPVGIFVEPGLPPSNAPRRKPALSGG